MLISLRGRLAHAARTLAVAAVISVTAATAHADGITGAGATFPAPIYAKWGEEYAKTGGDKLNYQPIGSGAGVTQIINRTVDFGASDSPVSADRLKDKDLLQFPAVIGAEVMVVNVPGVDGNQLKLTGPLIGEIYLGHVRTWNAKEIQEINPGVKLPPIPIAPIYRADSSGTTSIFTNYLASVNPDFKVKIGAGNSVPWRTGIGGPGNSGVAASVQNTKGGIGYVEYAFATENKMQMPSIANRAGQYVRPSAPAFQAAATQADWVGAPNMAASMLNMGGDGTWPIVSATYILVPKTPADPKTATRVLKFFDWAFSNGGPTADKLHYVMLPQAAQDLARKSWLQVKGAWPGG